MLGEASQELFILYLGLHSLNISNQCKYVFTENISAQTIEATTK